MLRSSALSTERILVLDDDESVAQFVGDALGVLGFQIELAHVPSDAYLAAKNKRFDLIVIFLAKNRARRVQQFTISADELPKRVQDLTLTLGESRDVVGTSEPFDVGVPPHDAGSRARHVGKNVLVTRAVPPRGGLSGVARDDARRQTKALEVRLHADVMDRVYLSVLRRRLGIAVQYDRSTRRFQR